ncbi:redoxin family protein [Ramlibacter humi]|uniref:Redoxin domain-containing protein n=1 Tax=Ramlibacter humi TaxID=2530451 RepID=A0A4Z0BFM5_9BURK|nr:redoxin family protein [Ramlibacter humi]TFY96668.1 redoxin domain-containing protein [Ramlibacter humi]
MNARPLALHWRRLAGKGFAALAAIIAITCVQWSPGEARAAGLFSRPAADIQSLDGAVSWVNSPPLTPQSLRGKVVLLDFWTYSCINCLRTLPYIRAWAEKYRDLGFVVVGVHTPEFGFEHQPANVQRAAAKLGITFPVAVDSRRAIWRAYGVQGWPSLYLADAKGMIRNRQLGEGGYAQSERVIQQLLREAGRTGVPTDLVSPQGEGTQAAAGPMPAQSPETYVGAAQAERFRSPEGPLRLGPSHAYQPATSLALNEWTLAGDWKVGEEAAELQRTGGRIAYRFRARDLHLVLGPAMEGKPVRFRVRLDGQAPGADHGSDVDANGIGMIDSHRLYQLVRQSSPGRERLFEIEFLDPGVSAYAFTFG